MAAPKPTGGPDRGGATGGVRGAMGNKTAEEPVWLVRAIIVLFLLGFSAYLGQQAWALLR